MPRWRVQLFGGFRVDSEDQTIRGFRTRGVDSLFAFLALHLGQEVRKDELIEHGWPNAGQIDGSQNLRTALHDMRRKLGPETVRADRDVVFLDSESFEVDVLEFRSQRDPRLYQGRLLPGFNGAWIWPIAQELEDLYVQCVLEMMDRSSPADAAQLAQDALRLDPSLVAVRHALRRIGGDGEGANRPGSPHFHTSFVGRHREIAQLESLLSAHRLVTLTGLGGSGKSRLASELWRRSQPDSWFVSLADVLEPEQIGDAVRIQLRLPESPGLTGLQRVIATLRDEEGLLILDNFEHLALGSQIVAELIEACPRIRIAVTSRLSLDLGIGIDYPVGPLATVPGADGSPSESAQLFVARAQAVAPDFSMTEGNQQAVAELCRRLDGVPLALELAAARARVFSPEEMLAQLDDRFEFLSKTEGAKGVGHVSFLHALDWSFDRLDQRSQAMLCALSVFEGGFTLEAAVEVCGVSPQGSELDALLSAAWIGRAPTTGSTRFRLLESVRDYCKSLLKKTESAALRSTHADYFVRLAEACFEQVYLPQEEQAFRRVRDESGNLDAAWHSLYDAGGEDLLRLANGLNWYWRQSGLCAFGERRMREAIDRASDEPRPLLTAAMHSLATLILFQGRFEDCIEVSRRTHELAVQTGDNLYHGLPLLNSGFSKAELGDYDSARAHAAQAIQHLLLDKNQNWIAAGYTVAALIENRCGNAGEAIAAGKLAVEYGRKGGYPWAIASALNELAMAYHLAEDWDRSLEAQLESIELKQQGQALPSLALSYADLAATQLAVGNLSGARNSLIEWARLANLLHDPESNHRVFASLAELFAARQEPDWAVSALVAFRRLTQDRPMNAGERQSLARAERQIESGFMAADRSIPGSIDALFTALRGL